MQWTPEQKRAIDLDTGKGNIIVSAAAGSGKTAVLVERIFDKINKYKYDIDSFLVVTFTKAAAAGMKNKIEERFRKSLSEAETKEEQAFWSRQLRLLGTAEITTIDAFCLNILKNNFQHTGIDPNFFIMDDIAYKILREKVIEDVFDKLYETDDSGFLKLADRYASFRSDDKLIRLILYIHEFISNFAEPFKWLKEKSEMYTEDMSQSPWWAVCIKYYIKPIAHKLKSNAEKLLDDMAYSVTGLNEEFLKARHIAEETRKNYSQITDSLELMVKAAEELILVKDLQGLCEWNVKYDSGKNLLAENIPSKITDKLKKIEGFEAYMKQTKELQKKTETELSPMAFKQTEEIKSRSAVMHETAAELYRITALFDEALTEAKHKKNSYTFLDIEHMTYDLFRDNTDIRREYTNRYTEILIDEYQDTNGLQDAIFTEISRDNIFMVGDLKQSIYRFRGGDPYIFKAKSREYQDEKNSGTRVDLAKNFRSRQEVIDSVNDVFDMVMSETVGDVNYVGDERLVCGMENDKEEFYKSEMHIIENLKTAENDESIDYIEAEYIAKKIEELYGREFYDSKSDTRRKLKYSDFVILLRAVKNSVQIYGEVFEKHGIPFFAEINDYFENSEIKAMTALISVIDNARRDVPLITAMRSAIFNFTDSELAYIKINFGHGKKYFYDRVVECAKSQGRLSKRCSELVNSITRWRSYLKRKSTAELIWAIYEETGFYDCASAAGGEAAQSNLNLLYERAKLYERKGFKGLFSFVQYIENLKEQSKDMTGARLIRHDVVGLMTIHKSKGLEFPVVFLGGMGKRALLTSTDGDGRVVLHKDYGLGLMYPDTENEFYAITPYKTVTDTQNKREDISEKMRLLYVALTRAQYKLIAVATYTCTDDDAFKSTMEKLKSKAEHMDEIDVLAGIKYSDWLIPAAIKSDNWEIITALWEKPDEENEAKEDRELKAYDEQALRDEVYKLLDYEYPYRESSVIPSRTTATEMKQLKKRQKNYYIQKPLFLSERKNAAKRGTAYHNSIAYINLDKIKEGLSIDKIKAELKRMGDAGEVDSRYIDEKLAESMYNFFVSDLGRRMLNADKIYREQSFQTLMDSSEYDSDIKVSEKMILQGVIDCFFVEKDNNAVLVDYKTDKIKNGDVTPAVKNYTLQIELYSKAIEQVAGMRVKERYLYLFDINKGIKI